MQIYYKASSIPFEGCSRGFRQTKAHQLSPVRSGGPQTAGFVATIVVA